MLNDTPLTNWMAESAGDLDPSMEVVPADFARNQEREIISLRKSLKEMLEHNEN